MNSKLGRDGEYGNIKGSVIQIGSEGKIPIGTDLFNYQARVNASLFEVLNHCKITDLGDSRLMITSAKLAAQLGAGKTRIFFALIHELLNSANSKNMVPLVYTSPVGSEKDINSSPGYHVMVKKYDSVLNTAFVFATPATFRQMIVENKASGANLRIFPVENVIHFRELLSLIDNRKINNYDVVLFIVTTAATYGQATYVGCEHSITALLYALAERRLAIRFAVYDDYDTGMLGHNSPIIPALQSLYVSATASDHPEKERRSPVVLSHNYTDIITPLLLFTENTSTVVRNEVNLPAVRIHPDIVNEQTGIPALVYHDIVFKQRLDALLSLARTIGSDDYKKYIELINGGAYEAASEVLGVSSGSDPKNVLMDLFRNNWFHTLYSKRAIGLIEKMLAGKATQEAWRQNKLLDRHGDFPAVEKMIKTFSETNDGEYVRTTGTKLVQALSTDSAKQLEDLLANYRKKFALHSADVATMLANFQNAANSNCPGCGDPENRPTTLITCCLKMACEKCLYSGNGKRVGSGAIFQLNQVSGGKASMSCGLCGKASTDRNPIRCAKIATTNGTKVEIDLNEWFKQTATPTPPPDTGRKINKKYGPKNIVLVKICRGEPIVVAGKVVRHTTNMDGFAIQKNAIISGVGYKEPPKDGPRPIVVVSEAFETLRATSFVLTEEGITSCILSGSAGEIAATVARHMAGEFQVLLICRQVTCQGLNLQYSAALVLMHNLDDTTSTAQFIGRIQRPGRTYSGTVYRLLYQNEA